ncbi:hypothetical protein N836_32080 [Leptolyngbya sp. Heron Island J]|uniref:toll/interleukin-1 receptor domain-containing protein n=1 Tax=Leptolyngbya sp. Heron Island J TaxID=1385935 RepID=UPI0003B9982B|nr:toll/interleukin-1 receptor domain-containing protein [Leptolyngbya sp. Heron Island J]ESA38579.1 hypothetical protein N836_32080 [Leptolyngbya sp. Heron Island J]
MIGQICWVDERWDKRRKYWFCFNPTYRLKNSEMRIFISYRRADVGGHADIFVGRIADRLIAHFGESNVFLDIQTIPVGREFDEFIFEQIAQADALLAIIGPDWLTELKVREEEKEDFVKAEIQSALNRGVHLIPVLIGGAFMPGTDQLPESLKRLSRKNAFAVDSGRDFHPHLTNLINKLESLTIPTYIDKGPFRGIRESYNKGNTLRFQIHEKDELLSYNDVIERWIHDDQFRSFFRSLLYDSGLSSYVWETPPITSNHLNRPFEFVLLSLPKRFGSPDRETYAQYFNVDAGDNGVIAFDNLGKDALLVVPSPCKTDVDYTNLAAFLRNAPEIQQHALWRMLGRCVKQRLSSKPLWISVAGGGVAWLHVRLDSYPKYYRYMQYRAEP